MPATAPINQQGGNEDRCRAGRAKQLRAAGSDRDGAEIELAFGADIPEPRPEGDGGGEAGQHQRCGPRSASRSPTAASRRRR